MCDPVVGMTIIGVGTAASVGLQYAGIKQGQAATKKQQALDQKRTDIEVDNIRRRADRIRSAQRVAFAKSGVKMEGTPLEVLAQSARDAERDIANVRAGGALVNQVTAAQGTANSIAGYAGIGTTVTNTASTVLSGIQNQKRLEKYGGGN